MKATLLTLMVILGSASALAKDALDSIQTLLGDAPIQEKIYLHLDNNCYYRGEEIWYKAYVVRADDNSYTDLSRLLYVELVSPDGLLVERQTIKISDVGDGEGSFYLADSLYSGFYELRAYTRWMMNFCVTEHPSNYQSRQLFYNNQMADDFYRQYGTVYSRVVPVYETPEKPGDYTTKYIVERPKTRLGKEPKAELKVSFYPEGGHLIAGTRATVAFEAVNELGEQVNVSGRVGATAIKTEHEGRGAFTVDVPTDGRLETLFHYGGKDYTFDLPKPAKTGCALTVSADAGTVSADVVVRGQPADADCAAVVLSRGMLKVFRRFRPDAGGRATVSIDTAELPSGVSDLIIVDGDGRPMADRLFFVDHHDAAEPISLTTAKTDYQPYEAIDLELRVPEGTDQVSVSVRDAGTDDPTYDTGNIMTELLLSSELKGFIPHPDYYFEADDQQHRRHLDLLLMVQGWRRYDYGEMTDGKPLRYGPEQQLSVEGNVYSTIPTDWEVDEVQYWSQGVFGYSETKALHADPSDPVYKELTERISGIKTEEKKEMSIDGTMELETMGEAIFVRNPTELQNVSSSTVNEERKVAEGRGQLKHEVTVECELVELDDNGLQLPGSTVTTFKAETTNGGHFRFDLPDYKNAGALFLRAYKSGLDDKKLRKRLNSGFLSEEEIADYFVKRDLFFPVFAKKYSYYQCHLPNDDDGGLQTIAADQVKALDSISRMDRVISEVTVKKRRRRGRRAIDYTKPVCAYDTYELYNLCTDLGLCYGQFDMMRFPEAVSTALFGTYNKDRYFNVRARFKEEFSTPYIFFRNYALRFPTQGPFISSYKVAGWMKLARQDIVRFYTDFDLRNEDQPVVMQNDAADITLQFDLLPSEGERPVWRDRRIIVPGIIEPDEFYLKPDYSRRPPRPDSYDYRRTLYWDPAATPDDDGRLRLHLYNNGKQSRICVSAAGIDEEGRLLYLSEYAK